MIRLCIPALALMACGVVAAPAPVYRPSEAPKTAFEVMQAGLRKTGKATGIRSKDGGTWTLAVEKVEGERLEKVVSTSIGASGRITMTLEANGARIKAEGDEKNVFSLVLDGVAFEGFGNQGVADRLTVDLISPP